MLLVSLLLLCGRCADRSTLIGYHIRQFVAAMAHKQLEKKDLDSGKFRTAYFFFPAAEFQWEAHRFVIRNDNLKELSKHIQEETVRGVLFVMLFVGAKHRNHLIAQCEKLLTSHASLRKLELDTHAEFHEKLGRIQDYVRNSQNTSPPTLVSSLQVNLPKFLKKLVALEMSKLFTSNLDLDVLGEDVVQEQRIAEAAVHLQSMCQNFGVRWEAFQHDWLHYAQGCMSDVTV